MYIKQTSKRQLAGECIIRKTIREIMNGEKHAEGWRWYRHTRVYISPPPPVKTVNDNKRIKWSRNLATSPERRTKIYDFVRHRIHRYRMENVRVVFRLLQVQREFSIRNHDHFYNEIRRVPVMSGSKGQLCCYYSCFLFELCARYKLNHIQNVCVYMYIYYCTVEFGVFFFFFCSKHTICAGKNICLRRFLRRTKKPPRIGFCFFKN